MNVSGIWNALIGGWFNTNVCDNTGEIENTTPRLNNHQKKVNKLALKKLSQDQFGKKTKKS